MVPGYGHVAGAPLAAHPDVQKVSFTGSTEVGRRIVEASAGNLKRLQLELGGKGANIVFADADVAAAVNRSAFAIFHNQGQACIAGSRLILEEPIAAEFQERFLELARSIRLGDPLDPATEMGPLTPRAPRPGAGVREGGPRRGRGGPVRRPRPDDPALARGCYVEPTVVRADPAARVNREEVFGPFVTVTTFSGEAEALELANAVDYGLVGCGPATSPGPTRWRGRSGRAWSGSTATSGSAPARRSAGWATPATAARWASRPCTATPIPSRSGSTWTRTCPSVPALMPDPAGLRRLDFPEPFGYQSGAMPPSSFTYDALPGRVVFGVGAADRLGEEVDRLGARRVLAIAGKRAVDGLVERLGGRWAASFTDVQQHVPVEAAAAVAAAGEAGADCLVAMGGGSATGMAKAVALEHEAQSVAVRPPPTPAPR